MRENPKEFQVYRHFKGNYYQVLNIAINTETEEELVIYRSLYEPQKIYARPLGMFMEETDTNKYPDADQKYRFELVTGKEKEPSKEAPKQREETVKAESVQSTDEALADFDDFVIDAELEKFLDEKSYEKKLERLVYLKKKADDEMLNTIAMSLDLELSKTSVEDKYAEILDCLKTLEKYECNRLR